MRLKEEIIRKFRTLQTFFSIFLFFLIFAFFSINTDFNLKDIQISNWGTIKNVGWIFNYGLKIIAITSFFNIFLFINRHKRIYKKCFLKILFLIPFLSLFFVGFFSVDKYELTHNIYAYIYFFSLPLMIFLFSFLNRNHIIYSEWLMHLIISILMVVFPIILINFFNGKAIPEIIHTCFFIYWSIRILFKFH